MPQETEIAAFQLVPSTDWKNLPIEASRIAAVLANDVDRLSFQRNLSASSRHQPVAFPPACRSFIARTYRKKKIHRRPGSYPVS
jgi:hypothetical protein